MRCCVKTRWNGKNITQELTTDESLTRDHTAANAKNESSVQARISSDISQVRIISRRISTPGPDIKDIKKEAWISVMISTHGSDIEYQTGVQANTRWERISSKKIKQETMISRRISTPGPDIKISRRGCEYQWWYRLTELIMDIKPEWVLPKLITSANACRTSNKY